MEREKNGNSKLKEENVLQIYDLIKKDYNNNYIANIFNLNFKTISQIRTGFRWNYLFKKHMKEIIKSNSLKTNNLENNLKLIKDLINSSKSNVTLSKKYNLEVSMISRIKNKKTWMQIWNLYNRSATTISKESTL